MAWLLDHPFVSLSYGFLYLTVLSLWLPSSSRVPVWVYSLILAIGFGLTSQQLDLVALPSLGLFALAAFFSETKRVKKPVRFVAGIFVFILGILLGAHALPGFHKLLVLDRVMLSYHAIPFTLYLGFDKTLVGIFILGFSHRLIKTKREWKDLFRELTLEAPIVILITVILAFILGFVRFDFKIPNIIFIWFFTNLLFTCMAEEAFFRGFIQRNLALMLKNIRLGDYLAIFITSILFGLAHYGDTRYMLLATVAGAGYGWIYFKTKKIEGSILTHFALNLTQFIFFTYPALQTLT